MFYTRRDLAKLAVGAAALPGLLSRSASAATKMLDSKVHGVQLGVQSYSFRDLPIDQAIQAMSADGLGECELFSPHIEAGGMHNGKSMAEHAKIEHEWRMSVPLDYFADVKKKFNDAGIKLYAYNLSFNDHFTNDEIDRGFLMAKALGVGIITASTTLPVAQRVVPFAEKHKMIVAMHGHSDLKDPNQFATPKASPKRWRCRSITESIWISAILRRQISMRSTLSARTTIKSC